MYDDAKPANDSSPGRSGRLRTACAGAALAAALLLAACGGGASTTPRVAATAGSSPTKSDQSTSVKSTKGGALAYSKCMRSHGVPDFPDPNSKGQIQLTAEPGSDLSPGSAQLKAAQQACKALAPTATATRQSQDFAKNLRFSRCMRSHGVSGFPDPTPAGGGPQTQSQQGPATAKSQFDPNSPQFKTALAACRQYVPSGAEVGGDGGS